MALHTDLISRAVTTVTDPYPAQAYRTPAINSVESILLLHTQSGRKSLHQHRQELFACWIILVYIIFLLSAFFQFLQCDSLNRLSHFKTADSKNSIVLLNNALWLQKVPEALVNGSVYVLQTCHSAQSCCSVNLRKSGNAAFFTCFVCFLTINVFATESTYNAWLLCVCWIKLDENNLKKLFHIYFFPTSN